MGKVLSAIVGLLALMALMVVIALFFIKIGWTLFMVPVFGLAELTWTQALGFSLLAAAFRGSSTKAKE